MQRFVAAAQALLGFPAFSLQQFAGVRLYTIGQVEPHLLSATAWEGYRWLLRLTWIQALICYAGILAAAVMILLRRVRLPDLIRPQHRLTAIMLALFMLGVVLCYMLAPLLGGPSWGQGERLDQVTQFLPFLLAFWFLTPIVLELPGRLRNALRRLTWISAVLYTVVSMAVGLLIVYENLRYRGPKLTNSDVPVYDKLRLVAFVSARLEGPVGEFSRSPSTTTWAAAAGIGSATLGRRTWSGIPRRTRSVGLSIMNC